MQKFKFAVVLLCLVAVGVQAQDIGSAWTGPSGQGAMYYYNTTSGVTRQRVVFGKDTTTITNLVVGGTFSPPTGYAHPASDGALITNLPAGTAIAAGSALPAVDGSAVTNITAGKVQVGGKFLAQDASALTNITAGKIEAGGTFLAQSAQNLTNITAGKIAAGGTFLAQSAQALTNGAATFVNAGICWPANDLKNGTNLAAAAINAGFLYAAGDGKNLTNADATTVFNAGDVFGALDGSALTNVTGTVSANGTTLNALNLLNCTNLPLTGLAASALPQYDIAGFTNGTLGNGRLDADLQPLAVDDGGGLTNLQASTLLPGVGVNATNLIIGVGYTTTVTISHGRVTGWATVP